LNDRRNAVLVLLLWALVLVLGVLVATLTPGWFRDVEAVRRFFLGFGVLAPVAFVLVQAAQVVVAPVPGQVLVFVSGYLFGAVLGTGLSLLGATIGTYVAVRLARRYGRPVVERLVPSDTIDHFDAAVERRGLLALFVVFLIPGLPDDAICLVAGLTRLDVRRVLLVSLVGRLPGYALASLAGDRLAGGHATETAALLGVLVVVSTVAYLGRGVLGRWLTGEDAADAADATDRP